MSTTPEELRSADALEENHTGTVSAAETTLNSQPLGEPETSTGLHPGGGGSVDAWLDVFDHMPVGISLTEIQGGLRVNDTYCHILGYSREELAGRSWMDITHPDDHEFDQERVRALIAGEKATFRWEKRYIHKDGHVVWADLSTTLRRDTNGTPLYFITTIVDITERKTAEAALRESERNFAAVFQNSPVAMSITEIETGRFVDVNHAFCQNSNFEREEIIGRTGVELAVYPRVEDRERLAAEVRKYGSVSGMEAEFRRKSGGVMHALISSCIIQRGNTPFFLTAIVDITEQNRALQALSSSEQQFRAIADTMPVALYIALVTGQEKRTLYINSAFTRLFGYTQDEVPTVAHWWPLAYPNAEYRAGVTTEWRRRLDEARITQTAVESFETVVTCKDGTERNISWWFVEAGDRNYAFGLDLTAQVRAHSELARVAGQYRSLAENSPDLIARFDEACRHLYVNNTAAKAGPLHPEGYVGKTMAEVGVPSGEAEKWMKRIRGVFESGSITEVEDTFDTPAGSRFFHTKFVPEYDHTGAIVSVQSIARDVTEQRLAVQSQLRMEQKYRKLHESMMDGFVFVSMDGRITECNAYYASMLGYTMEEVIGKTYPEITPESWHVFEQGLLENQILVRGFSDVYEKEYIRADGTVMPVELHTVLMRDNAAEPIGMWAIVRDITERKKADARTRLHQRRLESLLAILQSETADTKELLDITLEAALDMLESEIGYIFHYNEAAQEFTLNSWSGSVMPNCSVLDQRVVYKLEHTGLWGEAVRQRQPILVNDFQAPHPLKKGYPEGHVHLRNFLTIPVIFGGTIEAVVGMGNKATDYDHSDVLQLTVLMDSVWKEIDRRRNMNTLRWQTERLRFLHRMDQTILQALDSPDTIIEAALAQLRTQLHCHTIDAGILTQNAHEFRVFSIETDARSVSPAAPGRRPDLRVMLAMLEDGIYVPDIARHSKVYRDDSNPDGDVNAVSLLVPLRSAQGLRGILRLCWTGGRGINPDDAEVAEEVADQITIAIEQSRLLDERARYAQELERRVHERTAQLEEANRELEAFSYSVSHDLRAPLRHISGFVNLLLDSETEALSETGKHYLDSVADSASHMGVLIDDLLQFSRTGRQEMKETDVDLNVVVEQTIDLVRPSANERHIEWTIVPLPTIRGDRSLLHLVWLNLLSNAVKFTGTREHAKISIGVSESDTEFEFVVSDNGVGFDMQYADKLFGVFQRLHTLDEFDGTGIGLANVRRIITKHGGRTWADAQPDAGARFYFTIPKSETRAS